MRNKIARLYFVFIGFVLAGIFVFSVFTGVSAQSVTILNPDFDISLDSWEHVGRVWATGGNYSNGYASISIPDNNAISQNVEVLSAGSYYVEFEGNWDDVGSSPVVQWSIPHGDGYLAVNTSQDTVIDCVPPDIPDPIYYICTMPLSVAVAGSYRITFINTTVDAVSIFLGGVPSTPAPTGTPLPTVTPSPPTATPSPSFYLQHAPPDGSLTTGVHERGVCTGLSYTGDSLGLYTYEDFGCDGIVYPAPVPPEHMIGNVWDFRYSTYVGVNGNPNLGVKTAIDRVRYQLDSPSSIVTIRMCTNAFVSSAPQTFLDSIGCTLFVSDRGFSSFFGVEMRKGGVNIELVDAHYIMLGVPVPTPTPIPPTPSLPPSLGFGHNCTFTPTVGITGTITATLPISVSSSLVVDGGFETGGGGWRLYGEDDFVALVSGIETGDAYEGSHLYYAAHNENDLSDIYLCVDAYIPAGTDVLEFSGAFRSTLQQDIGFGINQGIYQAIVVSPNVDSLLWEYSSNRINSGGQSQVSICVDYPSGGGDGQDYSDFDALSVYALDRPDGVAADDFDNLELLCPDPDLVDDVGGTGDGATPTPTPDIFGDVTPVSLGTPVVGGLPPIIPAVGITPQPTRCVGWSEVSLPSITNTLPFLEVCLELNEVDLSGVDNAVDLPFSFVSLSTIFLSIAVAFSVINLVKNR